MLCRMWSGPGYSPGDCYRQQNVVLPTPTDFSTAACVGLSAGAHALLVRFEFERSNTGDSSCSDDLLPCVFRYLNHRAGESPYEENTSESR